MRCLPRLLCILSLMGSQTALSPCQSITITASSQGSFTEAMSTSFQAAPWTDPSFLAHPELLKLLDQLNPHHIRLQVIDRSIPEAAPGVWDFAALDRQLQPILNAADHSPEMQLAQAPAFLYRAKTNFVTSAFISGYAAYAAEMVRHYNAPGAEHPIRYWGILNEPNYFHISPAEYVRLYNAAVPAMLAVDPTIRIVALELGGAAEDEPRYVPAFTRGVRAQVDVIGLHLYSTCDERDTDQTLLDSIPRFVQLIKAMRYDLDRNPALRTAPIWILENNVNADFIDPQGNSPCNPHRAFVEDARGSSPFFPAWRAFAFSRFGKAGVQALYHWVFMGDRQYGEYNSEDDPPHLQTAYWIDFWLGRYFAPDASGTWLRVQQLPGVEVLAVRSGAGISILLANHRTANSQDHNGKGQPLEITLDVADLLKSRPDSATPKMAQLLTFGPIASPAVGPAEVPIPLTPKLHLKLSGYGVTLLHFD